MFRFRLRRLPPPICCLNPTSYRPHLRRVRIRPIFFLTVTHWNADSDPKPLAEQAVKDKARFREILTIAKRDPQAIEMWDKAAVADNLEYKRQWLRQYDSYVSGVMQKLEPRLKTTIVAWERGQVSTHSQHTLKPTIPLRVLQSSAH